jgi:hypothetical protein
MSDPQLTPPPYDEPTQQALERLSAVVWRCLIRLDQHERRAAAEQAQRSAPPPDTSTAEQQQPAEDGAPRDEQPC